MDFVKTLFITIFVVLFFGGITLKGWQELIELYGIHDYHGDAARRKPIVIFWLSVAIITAAVTWYAFVSYNTSLFN